jgi:hypothetical protein
MISNTMAPNFSPAPSTNQQNGTGVNGPLVGNPVNMPATIPTLPPFPVTNGSGFRREMLSNEDERLKGNQLS